MPLKSRTSDQDSTSSDPDFYEYWDSSRQDLYRQLLWLPETGSQGLDSSSLNGFAPNTTARSSFSITKTEPLKKSLERTSCPSYKYIVADGTVDAATKQTKDERSSKMRTLKLKLNPTKEQKALLAEFAGCSRFTYNKAVAAHLGEGSTHKTVFRIRDRFVTSLPRGKGRKPNPFFRNRQWLLRCPKSVRQSAIKAALANVKACFSNLKAGNIKQFSAPFRTKKTELERGWAIEMDQLNVSRDGNELFIFKDILGSMRYFGSKQLAKLMPGSNPVHDPKVQKSRFGEYFLVLSVDARDRRMERKPANPGRGAAASIDPGVRKTLVTYSPENEESFMIGKGQATGLVQLLISHDKLQSRIDTEPNIRSKGKMQIRRQMVRIRKRVYYLKKEFRDQTANFLAARYNLLLVPKLETGSMTISAGRKLTTKAARQMLTLSHSMLFTRLKEKCDEYGTTFLLVKEHYTSQTCPWCGFLNKCGETYHCKRCKFTCDRDIVGSAGIFLKAVRRLDPCL
jgi:putative transposase